MVRFEHYGALLINNYEQRNHTHLRKTNSFVTALGTFFP